MQKYVNISPYKFVSFVDTGMYPEYLFDIYDDDESINISVYFLVQYDNVFYLMNYRCFPWPINKGCI